MVQTLPSSDLGPLPFAGIAGLLKASNAMEKTWWDFNWVEEGVEMFKDFACSPSRVA